jgi:predicted Holliday junction resolvase-like endonuclease
MSSDIVRFFAVQRSIFGLCPCCGELFRLSDSRVFLRTRPKKDWMDILRARDARLDGVEERIDDAEEALREKARIVGRRSARLAVRRIDPVFAPRRLNADDAKVLFHPVDYVVFRGMKEQGTIREIILLDGETRAPDRIRLQKSIERVVEMGNYEWLTVRVQEDGGVVEE